MRCWTLRMESLWRPISISMSQILPTTVFNCFARDKEMGQPWPEMDRLELSHSLNRQVWFLMLMDICSLLIKGIIALLDLIEMVFAVWSDARGGRGQDLISCATRGWWVSIWMETSLSRIRTIGEFKNFSSLAILVVSSKYRQKREKSVIFRDWLTDCSARIGRWEDLSSRREEDNFFSKNNQFPCHRNRHTFDDKIAIFQKSTIKSSDL